MLIGLGIDIDVGDTGADGSPLVPTWFDTIPFASADTNDVQGDSGFTRWAQIPLPNGTASLIRVYIAANPFAQNLKVALYDALGNLLSSGATGGTPENDYAVVNITPVLLTAGSYSIAWKAQANADLAFRGSSTAGTTDLNFNDVPYGAFPSNPLPDDEFDVPCLDAVGVFITP